MGRKFGSKKMCKVESPDSTDYVFAYEDETSRSTAKSLMSFGPTSKQTDAPLFDYQSAFDYTGDSGPDSDGIPCDKYRTIFTYSDLPTSDPILAGIDDPVHKHSALSESWAAIMIYGLSGLLLLTLFPIMCWIFVKYVSRDERLVVFRLGKRLKLKGPGLVLLLPFCDRFFTIRLDEQTLEVGPVSGGTQDEALVEVLCSVTYRLTDPDYVCTTVQETPEKLLRKEAQLSLLSSLAKLPWTCLENGGAAQDLSSNTITSLNLRCSSYGIYVTNLAILNVRLERSPPSPEHLQKRRMSVIQKHLQAISTTLIQHTASALSSATTAHDPDSEPTKHLSEVGRRSRDHSAESVQPLVFGAQSLSSSAAAAVNPSMLPTTGVRNEVCIRAVGRVQPLLKNSLVCKALGHKRMQIIVSSNRPSLPLPSLVEASESKEFDLFYLDAQNGVAELGPLPATELPDVTLYSSAADLTDVIRGRLNLLDAIRDQTVFVTGDQVALDKLRHLLHF